MTRRSKQPVEIGVRRVLGRPINRRSESPGWELGWQPCVQCQGGTGVIHEDMLGRLVRVVQVIRAINVVVARFLPVHCRMLRISHGVHRGADPRQGYRLPKHGKQHEDEDDGTAHNFQYTGATFTLSSDGVWEDIFRGRTACKSCSCPRFLGAGSQQPLSCQARRGANPSNWRASAGVATGRSSRRLRSAMRCTSCALLVASSPLRK